MFAYDRPPQLLAYISLSSVSRWPLFTSRVVFSVPPMIWIQNQLIGAYVGQSLTLECLSEAHPKSINYWTREAGEIIAHGKQNTYGENINSTAADAADGKCQTIRPWSRGGESRWKKNEERERER
jgi:hypothetical protein